MSNENSIVQANLPWYKHLGLNLSQAESIWNDYSFSVIPENYMIHSKLESLLQVKLVKLVTNKTIPFAVIEISNSEMFAFAVKLGLVSLDEDMVLDKLHKDFDTKAYSDVLKLIGGSSPKQKKARKNVKK